MKLNKLIAGGLLALSTPLVFASSIALHAQPNNDSKVISKVDTANNFVEIIRGKDGWAKVGDSTNGQVGWVNIPKIKAANRQNHEEIAIENRIHKLDQMEKNLHSEHHQFMMNFEKRIKQINSDRSRSIQQLSDVKSGKAMYHPKDSVSFVEKSMIYNGGKNAKVTVTTLKDGKEVTKSFNVPVKKPEITL
tara:strand:- start:2095 stop:2667 length:573 start_codon:yes stop_codon:yes gene_type:complete